MRLVEKPGAGARSSVRHFHGADSAELSVFSFSVPHTELRDCWWIVAGCEMFFLFEVV